MEQDDQPIIVHVAGKAVQVWPHVSARTTRVRLSVKPGPKVILTYPPHASHASALAFLRDNLPWLERVLANSRTNGTCSGRGPIKLISPRITFHNCGNSSRRVRRNTRPTRVIRGSSACAKCTPGACNPWTMLRNLNNLNIKVMILLN
jgi:predicted metal-dependent hydrolase